MAKIKRNSTHEKRNQEDIKSKISSLPSEFNEILAQVPEEKKKHVLKSLLSVSISKSHSGPLPPPEILIEYNSIIKDGAERIMVMAEKQSSHRIQLENMVVKSQISQSKNAQLFALVIAILSLSISGGLAMYDHDIVAGVIGGTTVVGLVSTFILGKKAQAKDLKEKQN